MTRDDQGTAITHATLTDLEPVVDVARKIVAGEAFTDLDSIRVATALLDLLAGGPHPLIGTERPPESVFAEFRRLHGEDAR